MNELTLALIGEWLLAYRPTIDEKKFEPLRPADLDSLLDAAVRVYEQFGRS